MTVYDYLIIGGGSAGCVLANRLSARSRLQVALIEAGPDTPPDEVPDSIYAEGYLPDYFSETRYWTKLAVYRDAVGNRSPEEVRRDLQAHRYEQARVMGGGSSVNGQVALRGLPSDYDEWDSKGAAGWSWSDCLPYFKRLERDMDFDGELHGRDGPIAIRRTFPSEWAGFALAFREALKRQGIAYFPDCHAVFSDGCFPFPKNNVYGRRVSAAVAYLDSATRQRPNLHIFADTEVEALEFEGRRAVAVRARRRGQSVRLAAREIVVGAGALHSPALLMRAGIGPAEHLRSLGISVLADRPGVGGNLQDHPLVGIGVHLKPEARLKDSIKNAFLMYTRFSSGLPGCPPQDMKLSLGNRFDQTRVGHQFAAVRVGPDKAYSRGYVRLRSADAGEEPLVAFNLLSDSRDTARMIQGIRFAYRALMTEPVPQTAYSVFAGVYTDWIRKLSQKSLVNEVLTRTGAFLLDLHETPRELLMSRVKSRDFDIHAMIDDDRAVEDFARSAVLGNWHACGTCAIGGRDDPAAVVDPAGRVYGVDGLRVADASLMPSIPCANINLTTLMIAEKLADAWLGEAT